MESHGRGRTPQVEMGVAMKPAVLPSCIRVLGMGVISGHFFLMLSSRYLKSPHYKALWTCPRHCCDLYQWANAPRLIRMAIPSSPLQASPGQNSLSLLFLHYFRIFLLSSWLHPQMVCHLTIHPLFIAGAHFAVNSIC